MHLMIDNDSIIPAYMQLYTRLRENIISGLYSYGQRLPSKRVLADEIGISVITVTHAYEILSDEGYIESKERSGYFVSYNVGNVFPVNENREEIKEESIKISRHQEENTFPFSVFASTMRKVLTKYGDELFVKSPNFGAMQLRSAISSYLARSRGIEVEAEQIIIGSGSEYMYSLIVQLLGTEKTYALEDPSYEKIHNVYVANGAHCEFLKLQNEGIKTSELTKSKAEVLHVTPFNSYPSGITASASKRYEYIKWAKQRGAYIIEDDFDSEFTLSSKTADTLFSLEPENTVIYLNTFSKTIAPSMRVGYMVIPKGLVRMFNEKLGFYSCTVPVLEQYVLSELLSNGSFERHINKVRRKRRQES